MKASKSLDVIKIIRRIFTTSKLLKLMTSSYYSVLFYNSELWNPSNLNHQSKQRLLSARGNALRVCYHYQLQDVSFSDLHRLAKKTTPNEIGKFKIAMQLCRTFSFMMPVNE
jgi:hypothetical protein